MLLAAAALIKDAAHDQASRSTARRSPGRSSALRRRAARRRRRSSSRTSATDTLDAVVAATGVPIVPEPAGGNGFKIERAYYTPTASEIDIKTIGPERPRRRRAHRHGRHRAASGHLLVVDPIPAGFEIENPDISASGDVDAFDWLRRRAQRRRTPKRAPTASSRRSTATTATRSQFSVAYSMRAVSPGIFAQPAATVEDMYRPGQQARTDAGTVEVVGPTQVRRR